MDTAGTGAGVGQNLTCTLAPERVQLEQHGFVGVKEKLSA